MITSSSQAPAWRLWLASVTIAVWAFASLLRAMEEPSLGWRFTVAADQTIIAIPTQPERGPLHGVSTLTRTDPHGSLSVALSPMLLIESAGIHNEYAVHNRFFAEHRQIWQVLQGEQVHVAHAQGVSTVTPRPRGLDELGSRFWFPWAVGLLSMSVGLALWVYRPRELAARCFLLSSSGYAFGMLCTADWGSRLLTQPPDLWPGLHVASHAASFMVGGALCVLLWNRPQRLGGPWLPVAIVALSTLSVLADGLQWLPTISLAFRLPIVLVDATLFILFFLQWRAARNDPVRRAQLKWFGMLMFIGLSSVFVAYAVGATGRVVNIPQNYGLASVALFFVGLVPLVTRVGMFRLEAWWPRAWLWFLGGLIVVATDLFLLAAFDLTGESALAIALAIAGWIYFPVRQAVWRRMSQGALPATRDVLPQVLELVTRGQGNPAELTLRWRALWDTVFQPLRMQDRAGTPGSVATITDDGQTLQIQAPAGLPGLSLELPERGSRLFNPDDERRANEIARLVSHGLASHEAFERGARSERQRIASDLHDDLGARLLSIVHTSESPRVSELAREALNDMRLAVRGLTMSSVEADDALAQWRSECVTRLSDAGIAVDWQQAEPPAATRLSARLYVQLTRVLREAVNNILRHSGARRCAVRFQWSSQAIDLSISDDGQPAGLAAAGLAAGRGLAFMRTRIESLGGRLAHGPGQSGAELGGFWLRMQMPLEAQPVARGES